MSETMGQIIGGCMGLLLGLIIVVWDNRRAQRQRRAEFNARARLLFYPPKPWDWDEMLRGDPPRGL